jgi:hypothetical protein
MAIEIRELIIRTEVTSIGRGNGQADSKDKQVEKMKKQLLQEVKRMISAASRKNIHKR